MKSKKSMAKKALIGVGVVFGLLVMIGIIGALTTPKGTTNNTQASATQSKTDTKQGSDKPTTSLADLKTQVTPILTNQTNWEDNLMNNVQTAAAQSNAGNSDSTFHQFWDDLEHSIKYDTVTPEYNKASNAYFNAHQTQPAALDTWSTDIQQVYTDIQNYTRDTKSLLDDQTLGNPTDSDSTKVKNDQDAYKSDLAKARADITQL